MERGSSRGRPRGNFQQLLQRMRPLQDLYDTGTETGFPRVRGDQTSDGWGQRGRVWAFAGPSQALLFYPSKFQLSFHQIHSAARPPANLELQLLRDPGARMEYPPRQLPTNLSPVSNPSSHQAVSLPRQLRAHVL